MKKLLILAMALILTKGTIAQQQYDTSVNFTYDKPLSTEAEHLKAYLLKNDFKHRGTKAFETKQFSHAAQPIRAKYLSELKVDTAKVAGCTVFTLTPKSNPTGKTILYIHGGAYIFGISAFHWDLAAEMVQKTKATIIFPDYPLAPDHTAAEAFAMMEQVYKNILATASPGKVIFMGDSAGGGFVLALAEKLHKEGRPQPSQLIMLSPWLDISMTNPDIKALDEQDPVLDAASLQMAANAWAGKLDTKNYLVSPIYGNLKGLCKISLFIGGGELLVPDARKFKAIMDKKKIPVNYFFYPQMFHDWAIVTSTPEAKLAIDQISSLINGK